MHHVMPCSGYKKGEGGTLIGRAKADVMRFLRSSLLCRAELVARRNVTVFRSISLGFWAYAMLPLDSWNRYIRG